MTIIANTYLNIGTYIGFLWEWNVHVTFCLELDVFDLSLKALHSLLLVVCGMCTYCLAFTSL